MILNRKVFLKSVAFVTLFFCATILSAQEISTLSLIKIEKPIKHEISIGWGYGTELDFLSIGYAIAEIVPVIFKDATTKNAQSIGTFNLDYAYHITPKILVGANLSYSAIIGDKVKNKVKVGTHTLWGVCFMPTFKWNWLEKEHVSLYSRLSVGVLYLSSNDNYELGEKHYKSSYGEFAIGFQASPIGVEAGSKNYRGFVELGFGQAGIGQIGFRARF